MKNFFNIFIYIFKGILVLYCIIRGFNEVLKNNIESGVAFIALGITFITFLMWEIAEKDSGIIISLLKDIKDENLKISKFIQTNYNNKRIKKNISKKVKKNTT